MNELTRTPETVGAEIRGLTAQAKQMTLWFGIEIGRRLCEVKEMIGHGEWLPYLKAQTEFSQSTASRFMTLYREYGAQQQTLFGAESNYPTLNNLSISNALRLLALPENERESFAEAQSGAAEGQVGRARRSRLIHQRSRPSSGCRAPGTSPLFLIPQERAGRRKGTAACARKRAGGRRTICAGRRAWKRSRRPRGSAGRRGCAKC